MDADKWCDFYDRTKEDDGMKSAMVDLMGGFLRELKSRMEQASGATLPEEVVQEVDEMWREVASRHRELSPDGLKRFLHKKSPELAEMID